MRQRAPDWWSLDGPAWEFYPSVAAIGSVFGDPGRRYTEFLKGVDIAYPAEPYFFWNQPLWDSGLAVIPPAPTQTVARVAGAPSATSTSTTALVAQASEVKTGGAVRVGMVVESTVVLVLVSCVRLLLPLL
jgi:hypothetical protein